MALDASIKTARAGQSGKRFAGVADKVRKLVGVSKEATDRSYNVTNEIKKTMLKKQRKTLKCYWKISKKKNKR